MVRILILTFILLVIDFLAFQAVRQLLTSSGKSVKTLVYILYWVIPLITLIYVVGFSFGWSEHLPKGLQVTIRTMIFIMYFSKLLIGCIILVDDIRRLLFGALNMGFEDWKLSTERSRWMTYGALILGAIPVLSLTYGMARNQYRNHSVTN